MLGFVIPIPMAAALGYAEQTTQVCVAAEPCAGHALKGDGSGASSHDHAPRRDMFERAVASLVAPSTANKSFDH